MGRHAISDPVPGGLFQLVGPSESRDSQKLPERVVGIEELEGAQRLHRDPGKIVGVLGNDVDQGRFALVDDDFG